MDRRAFITALIGGIAAVGLGSATAVEAAPISDKAGEALPAETGLALDGADAEFVRHRRHHHRHHRRRRHPPRHWRRHHRRRHWHYRRYRIR